MRQKSSRYSDFLRLSYCDFSLQALKRIGEEFVSPSDFFKAQPSDRFRKGPRKRINDSAEMDFFLVETKLRANGVDLMSLEDEDYPSQLREIYSPPPLLYILGDRAILSRECIAIVGSRKCTPYGKNIASDFAMKLAAGDYAVVSGMAAGIDSHAHRGALKRGATIAVMASGIDQCYPSFNIALKQQIKETGCVITEFYPGQQPDAFRFPVRNRIISGLSSAVLVIEAKIRSGSLITARNAIEQGRDVYAVPGDINRITSEGTNFLIKNAMAYPLLNISEITGQAILEQDSIRLSEDEKKVMELVSSAPMSFDILMEKTGFDFGGLSGILFKLEFNNLIYRMNNNTYRGVNNG